MTSKFTTNIKFTTALISSAMLVSGCATDSSSFSEVQPIYRAQSNLRGVGSQSFYETGKRYFSEQRYGLALEVFQSELRQNRKSVNALNGIAACYDKLQRYDLAVNYYYQALSLDPESTRTLSNLGYSFLLQHRNTDAQRVLGLALKKEPGNVFIKRNLALATSRAMTASSGLKYDGVKKELSATKQPVPAETLLASDAESIEKNSKMPIGSNRSEPAAKGQIIRVTDRESTPVNAVEKVEAKSTADVSTVDSTAFLTGEGTSKMSGMTSLTTNTSVPEVKGSQIQKEEKSLRPVVATVAVADSELLPAIDIISQVEGPAERTATPQQVSDILPLINTGATASEPETVSELAVTDSGLLPNIEIISEVEEPTEQTVTSQQVSDISPKTNTNAAIGEPSILTGVADADRDLLPAIDIISDITQNDIETQELPGRVVETSAQNVPGIETIDVDVALTEENSIKVMLPVSDPAKQRDTMQEGRSISSVAVHDDFEYTIEVSNGNGWNGMARLLGNKLNGKEGSVVSLTNADTFNYKDTVIYYSNGKLKQAERLARQFPMQVQLEKTTLNRKNIDVRVVIGQDVIAYTAPTVRSSLFAWETDGIAKPIVASVEISNGNGRNGMAHLLQDVLVNRGDSIRRLTNADNFDYQNTVIYFSKGRNKEAQQLADKLPVQAILKETTTNKKDIDLKVVIGKDFLNYEVAMRRIVDANV